MKLRNKVILLPTMIMLVVFLLGMLSIELYLKDVLTQHLRERLHSLSTFALSSVELMPDKSSPSFDALADNIGQAHNIRVSFFNNNGDMLGDSSLTYQQVTLIENHANRPEIIEARNAKTSSSIRYSNTLKQNMAYFTAYNPNSGLFARIAMNSNMYHQTIINLRWQFSAIILITIIAIFAFGVLAMRLTTRTMQKSKALIEQRVADKTRQITLTQTMSTMLNRANSLADTDNVLAHTLPKILPQYSGAIFIKEKHKRKLSQLVSWGDNWPDDISVISNWRQQVNNNIDVISQNDLHIIKNIIYAGLKVNKTDLGVIYLIAPSNEINEQEQQLIENVTQQISFAFANLSVKNQLRNQAIRDPLTDLYNRRFMFEAFEQALNRAERHQKTLALLMIDIDDFKQFNDTFGHDAGDYVLVQVAHILKTKLRLEDIACRYGGEEFCVLCPETNLQDAYSLAEKLRILVHELSLNYADTSLTNISVSIGVAIHPNHGNTSNELIKSADIALYQAKDKGRNITLMAAPAKLDQKNQQQ